MTTITTRSGKGSPLTNAEVDANFLGLNDDKVEASGDSMTGNLSFGDNNKAIFGAGSDLQIYHDGSNSYISEGGDGELLLRTNGAGIRLQKNNGENMLKALTDGAVQLYYDNQDKLATTSTGIDVTGVITTDGMTTSADINFGDSDKAVFGAGSDLQIYHDGSHSYVTDAGTGNLNIQSNGVGVVIAHTDGTDLAVFNTGNSSVSLYNSGNLKLATTSTGIDVTGSITTDGLTSVGGFISIGADGAGDDFRFYGDTSGRYMEWVSSADSLLFRDGAKALFGNGSDLQIYHDGSNSYVKENGTGNLWVTSNGTSVGFGNNDLSELYAVFNNDGEAKLFFNGVQKFATSSTGIDVTGTVTADGISSSGDITITESTPSISFVDSDGTNQIGKLRQVADTTILSARNNTAYGNFKFTGEDGSTEKTRLQINGATGDISFYEDTGTTAKLFWDASAESLGIGTSSPAKTLHIVDTSSGNTTTPAMFQNSGGLGSAVELRLAPTPYPNEIGSTARWSAIRAINSDVGNATDLAFLTNDISADPTERMRIDSSGNVGIGTDSPQASLSLASSTSDSNGIKMQASGWPHYVRSGINGTTGSQFIQSTNWNAATNTVDSSSHAATALILDTSSGSIQFRTETTNTVPTERMRIDSSGNVGIGTTSPSQKLSVAGNIASTGVATPEIELVPTGSVGNADIRFNGTTLDIRSNSASASLLLSTASTERMRIDSGGNAIFTKSNGAYLQLKDASAVRGAINVETSDGLVFTTGASFTERMRIDSSGTLLVGTTDSDPSNNSANSSADNGIASFASGEFVSTAYKATANTGSVGYFNRTGTDGAVLEFRKSGSTVGSIGSTSSELGIGGGDANLLFMPNDNAIAPSGTSSGGASDGVLDLGRSARRFKDLYLSGGVYLGGTGSANKLDDYEEGTFTPTISSGTVTYTAQRGRYTKIGRVVYIHAFVQIASISGSSGTAIISGLPFVAKNDSNYSALASKTNGFNWGGSATMITFQVTPNTAVIGAVGSGNNIAFNDVNSSGLAAGDWIACTGHYVTDS